MKYIVYLFISVLSFNCFANINNYNFMNMGIEIYIKESPSYFSIDKNIPYNQINEKENNFNLIVLDSSQLDSGYLFLTLSNLDNINLDFSGMGHHKSKSITIILNDIYSESLQNGKTPLFINNQSKESINLNITGLNSEYLKVKSKYDLVINPKNTNIDRFDIEVPENAFQSDSLFQESNNKNLIVVKKGWDY